MSVTRGSVAIVGAAESDLGAVAAGMSPIDLMAQGVDRALRDAGLSLKNVDALFCATTQARTSALSLAEYLGLPDAYTDSTIVGGSSFEVHVAHAHAALEAGLCSVAVVAYGQHPAHGRAAGGERPGVQPIRDSVQAVPAGQCLCPGGEPPHARIRHDAGADGGGRRGGARVGAAPQPPRRELKPWPWRRARGRC